MVAGVFLGLVPQLVPACGGLPTGDPGQQGPEKIVYSFGFLLSFTAITIIDPIIASIASPSTISKGESNIITSLFFASFAPGVERP